MSALRHLTDILSYPHRCSLSAMTGQTNYRRDCLWTVEEALDGSAEARDRNLFERIF
jgi:hypothetical protein